MGLRIKTNVPSIVGQRNLGIVTRDLNSHLEKLSSGFRINRADDDAAGMAISEKLRANITSLAQAKRNASDGVALVQTAEGALQEISNITTRLRELSVQAASDTIGDNERGYLNQEFKALLNEVDRIATVSEFNGTRLLTGRTELPPSLRNNANPPPLEIQVGANFFEETDGLQNPKPVNTIRIDLQNINALTEGPGSLELGATDYADAVQVGSKAMAQRSIERVDNALQKINSYRANLGAVQNRLGSVINNLGVQIENLSSAKSRIKDADFAEESAQVAQQKILQESGIMVLAQANQSPQLALKLLQ